MRGCVRKCAEEKKWAEGGRMFDLWRVAWLCRLEGRWSGGSDSWGEASTLRRQHVMWLR